MSGYRTQSPDTSPEVERLQVERWRTMSSVEKLELVEELSSTADELALQGLRERHPGADDRELRLRLACMKYGRDLVRRAYGWSPPDEA